MLLSFWNTTKTIKFKLKLSNQNHSIRQCLIIFHQVWYNNLMGNTNYFVVNPLLFTVKGLTNVLLRGENIIIKLVYVTQMLYFLLIVV